MAKIFRMIKHFAYYSTNLHILLFVCMTVASHKLDTCDKLPGTFNFLAVLSHKKLIELFCFLTGRVCKCSGVFGGGAGGDQSTHPNLLLWYRDWADVDPVLTCSVPGV